MRERRAKPGPLDDGAVDAGDEDGADDGAHDDAHLAILTVPSFPIVRTLHTPKAIVRWWCLPRRMLRWACHARAGVPRRAHRQFFTPTLHALQRKQCVPYSSKQVYAVVADVERYTEFLPFCSASRICARHGPASFDATLTLGFLAFSETYTSRVTLEPPCGVTAVSTDTNLFSHLSTRWRLTDGREPGTCELHFVLEMQLKSILQDQVCVSVCRAPLAAVPLAAAPLAAAGPPGAPHPPPAPFPLPCTGAAARDGARGRAAGGRLPQTV